ncbi:nitrate/nitrite transporter, partial [Thermodesulfobacteriota bacterium]
GRLLAGIGTTLLLVVTLHAITSWFREREIGLSMGIYNMAMPLGTILSLNFGGIFAAAFGWRASISAIFIISIIAFLLFLIFYREKNSETGIGTKGQTLFKILKKTGWEIWLVSSMWGLLNAAIIPYFTFAPDYFADLGKGLSRAGLLASYPMWASFLLSPVVGLLIDRIGRRRLLIFVGFIVSAILYYLIPRYPQYAAIFAVSIGVSATIQPTPIFSLSAELLPASVKGVGFGILTTSGAIGMVLGPYITGSLRDVTGGYLSSFNAMAIMALLGVVPTLLLKSRFGAKEPHPI